MIEAQDYQQPVAARVEPADRVPTRLSMLRFAACAAGLRARRMARDLAHGIRRWPPGEAGAFAVLAESRSPLWMEAAPAEAALQRGKVENLRHALRRLDRTLVPAGEVFSFWKQAGRASRWRGYVAGRELREGCLVPAIGGGLCQLSNALYDAALDAGLEIIERHPHSRVIPGSAAAAGRDATVAWNYVDLRFRAPCPFMIRARLTRDELIIRVLGAPARAGEPAGPERAGEERVRGDRLPAEGGSPIPGAPRIAILVEPVCAAPRSCVSCGIASCFRHHQRWAKNGAAGRTAFLLDERWPEFERYVSAARREGDLLGIPLDGARWRLPRYAWDTGGFERVVAATAQTLLRSFATRRLGHYGAARLQAQLDGAQALARHLGRALGPDVVRVCAAQSLLPFLWRDGQLGGREFAVLMTRLPLRTLHTRLDAAAERHPNRRILREFRAPDWLVHAESEALEAADAIISPHREVADLFSGRAIRSEWHVPPPPVWTPGTVVAFPGPTAARKGAYELREVARELGLQVLLLGSELEGPDFWQGVTTRRLDASERSRWLHGVRAVVQPALVEDQPRALLAAVAAGVPVIATRACGLPAGAAALVEPGDAPGLRAAALAALRRGD